jgi:hypothetical protein
VAKDRRRVEPELAREILNYFLRHPQAADDLEGLARWRLMREKVRRTIEQTDEAIRWLVAKGFLEEIVTPGGRVFRLKGRRSRESQEFSSPVGLCLKKPSWAVVDGPLQYRLHKAVVGAL